VNSIFRLRHNQRLDFGDKTECVYWDYSKNDWSSEGCLLIENESNRYFTVCECNHLTNFAALMDPTEDDDDTLKSDLTVICCGVSAIFLVFTVLLLLLAIDKKNPSIFQKLKDKRNLITFNLSLCLIVTNLLIVFGMDEVDIEPKVNTFIIVLKNVLINENLN